MKKRIIIITILILILIIVLIVHNNPYKNKREITQVTEKVKTNNLAIMIENDEGGYDLGDMNIWPTKEDGYIFNDVLSSCENGGELSWNDGKITLKTNTSDKCYVYFDKLPKGLITNVSVSSVMANQLSFDVDIEKYTNEDLEMQYQVDGDKLWYHNTKNDVTEDKTYNFSIMTLNAILLKPNQEYKVNIRLVDSNENIVDSTSIKESTNDIKWSSELSANPNNALAIMWEGLAEIQGILDEAEISINIVDYKVYDKVEVEGDIYLYPNGYILDGFQVLEANSHEISEAIMQYVGPMTIYWYDNTTKKRVSEIYDFPMCLQHRIHEFEFDDYYEQHYEELPYNAELKKLGQNLELWNEDFSEFTPSWTRKDYSLVLEFANGTFKLKANAAY